MLENMIVYALSEDLINFYSYECTEYCFLYVLWPQGMLFVNIPISN